MKTDWPVVVWSRTGKLHLAQRGRTLCGRPDDTYWLELHGGLSGRWQAVQKLGSACLMCDEVLRAREERAAS